MDHQKLKTFHEISNGQTFISMSDLIQYMETNGFYPRTEDLEAILRRCDHDADRALSYEEFCEVTELEQGEDEDQESVVHDSKTNNNSPQRKEIQQEVSNAQKGKRRNSNDKLDSAPKENIEEAMERKEAEERERQIIEERQRRYEATGKLVGYLQDKITEFVNLDLQKKLLSYHGSFNASELFRDMDKDNHGYLEAVNFEEYFAEDEDLIGYNFANLIKYWSRYEEDKLTYGDFNNGIAPYSGAASMGGGGGYGGYGSSAGRYQPY